MSEERYTKLRQALGQAQGVCNSIVEAQNSIRTAIRAAHNLEEHGEHVDEIDTFHHHRHHRRYNNSTHELVTELRELHLKLNQIAVVAFQVENVAKVTIDADDRKEAGDD